MFKAIKNHYRAFSFTEMIIAITLFLLLAGVGMGAYFTFFTNSLVNGDINNSLRAMTQARFSALKNANNSDFGVYLDGAENELVLFEAPYNASNPGNITFKLEYLFIGDRDLQPSPGVTDQIVFTNKSGKTSNNGTFTLTRGDFEHTFIINSQGLVN